MTLNRKLSWVLCLLLLTGIGACSSNKKKELEPVKLQSFTKAVHLETLWSRKVGSGTGKFYNQFTPAIDGNFIYAASENGKVYKFDKLTGKKAWKANVKNKLTSGVAVDDERVFVSTINGFMIALDKETGKQMWSHDVQTEIVSAAGVNSDHLIVQAVNGEVFDLNTEDGSQRWRYDSPMPALTFRGNSKVVFFANYVVVGLANGKLAVLDVTTGQLMWEPKIADPKGDTEIERVVDVDAQPVVADDKLLAVSIQGRLAAYDLHTGRLIWAEDESTYHDIDANYDKVLVTSADGVITAYDQQTGAVKWANEDFLRRKVSGPAIIGNYVVVADYKGYVHVLSLDDGHVVGRKRASWSAIRSSALVDQDRFYVMSSNGRLKAYKIGEIDN